MRVGFGFSSVTFRSRVFHSRGFSHPSVDTDEQSSWKLSAFLLNIQNVVTNSSCWHVCTLWFRYFIYSYYSRLHAVEIFHCTIRCINRICKKFHTKLLASAIHFHKIVHENTFALTPLCFIWVSSAIAKHARIVLTASCQCWRFIVNGITEI